MSNKAGAAVSAVLFGFLGFVFLIVGAPFVCWAVFLIPALGLGVFSYSLWARKHISDQKIIAENRAVRNLPVVTQEVVFQERSPGVYKLLLPQPHPTDRNR